MVVQLMSKVLWKRRRLRQRDRWTRGQLEEHQQRSLRLLREHAYARSPFYQQFHAGLTDSPLNQLPILTKATLMAHFDELFDGRYRVAATSGTTSRRDIFVWDLDEWASVLASYNRSFDWAGVKAGLTHRTRMAVVSSTTPWHQSARVGASVHSPWVPTLRLDSGDPLESLVERLNGFGPEVLVAYASMVKLLADEQLAGRLRISPGFVFSASEVLTNEAKRHAEEAWGRKPFDVYAATETAGIASECERHSGLHLFEDLVITEVVDENNDPVPPGVYGEKVLVTVLFSRTLPLIRYEMSDSVRLAEGPYCPCGLPFALIEDIQGRAEDVLRFPAASGGEVEVQPIVLHRVMEAVPAGGWQIVQEPNERLVVLLEGVGKGFADGALVEARRVEAIPRTALGKAPLIKSRVFVEGEDV